MLRPVIIRCRAALLLLAFVLGLGGQAASIAAMASPMRTPMQPEIAAVHPCPGCGMDAQQGAMAPGGCMAGSICGSIPGLPAQSAALGARGTASFAASLEPAVAGIVSAPEPHPPRSFLHT